MDRLYLLNNGNHIPKFGEVKENRGY